MDTQTLMDKFDLSAVFGKKSFWSEAKGVEIELLIDLDRNLFLRRGIQYTSLRNITRSG